MKDFLKIFFILCGFVAAFLFGRNYGEQTFKQGDEYQSFVKAKSEQSFLKNDIENARAKFQNILDSSENKKSEELLAEILQVFLIDLGLKIENQQNFVKTGSSIPALLNKPLIEIKTAHAVTNEKSDLAMKPEKIFDYKKLKSYEWILSNTQNREDLPANLKNVEIKDIDLFMKAAIDSKLEDDEKIFGSYRGKIKDVMNQEYATMAVDLSSVVKTAEENQVKGEIQIFKDGKGKSYEFNGEQLGYRFEGSSGVVIPVQKSAYFQLYKISETQQVVGYFYERLVNGTTKTIGSFILNRVDQF